MPYIAFIFSSWSTSHSHTASSYNSNVIMNYITWRRGFCRPQITDLFEFTQNLNNSLSMGKMKCVLCNDLYKFISVTGKALDSSRGHLQKAPLSNLFSAVMTFCLSIDFCFFEPHYLLLLPSHLFTHTDRQLHLKWNGNGKWKLSMLPPILNHTCMN